MTSIRSLSGIAAVSALVCAAPLAGQELALKGVVSISEFAATGTVANPYDDKLTTTGFGAHVRFRLGPLTLQPEVQVVTKGARISDTMLQDEQLRLEYLELPLLVVLPVRLGRLEPYGFGGGLVAVETRCRYVIKEEGLRTNFGCDASSGLTFDRSKVDYGLVAGGGAAYPIAGGRVFVDVRYTWGMNNIVDEDIDVELRNRTLGIAIGYMVSPVQGPRDR
jgi:hypothetical protein